MAYRAAVVGGSGYTGAELLRLLAGHPEIEVVHVTADSNAGASVADLYPSLRPAYGDLRCAPYDVADLSGLDLAFTALPHGASHGPRTSSTSAPTSGCRPTRTSVGTASRTPPPS